ncbi:MAG: cation:proton antiporter [Kiritimatiellia bacterium]
MNLLMLIGASVMLAYYGGRSVRKIKLPSLVGYMILGALLGGSCFNLFDDLSLGKLGFVSTIALGFVAFTIGMELKFTDLRNIGKPIAVVILAESFLAFAVVTVGLYLLAGDICLALVFGAMAPASAPAGTLAVIHECGAKGSLTKALYAVVGFDDGLAVMIFTFASSAAKVLLGREYGSVDSGVLPGLYHACGEILLAIAIGSVLGIVLTVLLKYVRDERDFLILTFATVLFVCGLSTTLGFSLILCNMMVGLVLANRARHSVMTGISSQLRNVMPLLFVLFFVLAGAHLEIGSLPTLGTIGIVYIVARSGGLIGGAWIGATIGKMDDKIRRYLGLGILSQAGVAIGLSLIVKHQLDELGTEHARQIGSFVITTIAATSVFFEIIGPILTRFALVKSGEASIAE